VKRAARGSRKIRDAKIAKNSPFAHHSTTLSGYILTTKPHTTTGKKTFKQQYLLQISPQFTNMVNFGPLAAEISPVGAPKLNSAGFASWQCYCTVLQQ